MWSGKGCEGMVKIMILMYDEWGRQRGGGGGCECIPNPEIGTTRKYVFFPLMVCNNIINEIAPHAEAPAIARGMFGSK